MTTALDYARETKNKIEVRSVNSKWHGMGLVLLAGTEGNTPACLHSFEKLTSSPCHACCCQREEGAPSSQGNGTVALCKAHGLSLECQLDLRLKVLHFG